jgi:hypothetical protein
MRRWAEGGWIRDAWVKERPRVLARLAKQRGKSKVARAAKAAIGSGEQLIVPPLPLRKDYCSAPVSICAQT